MYKMKNGLLAATVVLCAVLVGGCSPDKKEKTEKVVPVSTVRVKPTNGVQGYTYVGTVEEESGVSVSFKVQGTVIRVLVNEGQRVERGTVLAQMDTETLQQSYNAAKASYDQAQDAITRMKQLYDNKSLSEIKYVEAQTNLEQARSMYEIAAQNLRYATLTAPVAGVIGRRSVEPGENVMPGQTVMSVLDISTIKVRMAVPEKEIARLHEGEEAEISVPALGSDATFTGRIVEKGVTADGMSHTYDAKIRIDNRDGRLRLGMVCNVSVADGWQAGVSHIVLPCSVVQVNDRDEHFVWCVKDGRAVRTMVRTGGLTATGVEIIDGLKEGDEVVTEGFHKISEGMKVRVI